MTTHASLSDFYAQTKLNRHENQLEAMNQIMSKPQNSWAEALISRWPNKLPKAVRKALPKEALHGWRAKRSEKIDQDIREEMAVMEEFLAQMEADSSLMDTHGRAADEIYAIITSVADLKSVTVVSGRDHEVFESDDEDLELLLPIALCWALERGGGVTIRQALALRSQVRGEDGKMHWINQERVYGIACANGQWEAVTAAQMRHAYSHRPDGTPLPVDATTTFGNCQDLARKTKAGGRRH